MLPDLKNYASRGPILGCGKRFVSSPYCSSPCSRVAGAFLPWVIRPGRGTDYTSPSSIEVKNV